MGSIISLTKTNNSQSNSCSKASTGKSSISSNKETIFLFDWDDTLMCTSFVLSKVQPLSEEEIKLTTNLGAKVTIFLEKCIKYGKVIIMTNSNQEWLKKTSDQYLKIKESFFNNIKIISTRDLYLKSNKKKEKWKEMALNELLIKYGDKIENLICASDSEEDINIFKNISKLRKEINISTIKFKSKPSPQIMIKEIDFLTKTIFDTIGKSKHYYLIKERKKDDEFNFPFCNYFDYFFQN
jgi:hypothetical protein